MGYPFFQAVHNVKRDMVHTLHSLAFTVHRDGRDGVYVHAFIHSMHLSTLPGCYSADYNYAFLFGGLYCSHMQIHAAGCSMIRGTKIALHYFFTGFN